MFRITWVFAIAIGLISFCFPVLGQEQQSKSPLRQENTEQQPSKPRRPIPIQIIQDESAADARKSKEQEAEQREIKDLLAQEGMNRATQEINSATQVMRDYAIYSTWIVGFGTILLIVTLWLTYKAGKSAQDAIEITRETGRDQSRAYVHVEATELHWRSKEMEYPEIYVTIKNTGQTPAKWFEVSGVCCAIKYQTPIKSIREAGYTNSARSLRWSALAKGELTATLGAGNHSDEIKRAFEKRKTHYLSVVGVVRYETYFGEVFESEFDFFGHNIRGFYARRRNRNY